MFTIVTATSVSGTFNGLTEGATLSYNGQLMVIHYTATAVTLQLLDVTPPTVIGTTPSFATSGTLYTGTTWLQVNFSEPVVGGGTVGNYQLQSLGADGLLGTPDDAIVALSASYAGTTATLTFSALPESVYRLTVRDAITDAASNLLDGDGDGTAGGDWNRDFVVLTAPTVPYRWQTFNSYDNATSWLMGNNPAMFGGVAPSAWTDGNATAKDMSLDLSVLSTLFSHKGYVDKNAMVSADVDIAYSSTNGQVMAALFRIQNATASPITWNPSFYFSCYGGWGEWASVAVNGTNVWTSGGGGGLSQVTTSLALPANTTSTVIFTSTYGPQVNPIDTLFERAGQLGFLNNSLQLPSGLTFVDDLPAPVPYRWQVFNTYDNATGAWLMGNNSALFGGVAPSTWTDGNGTAGNMSTDLRVLSTLFNNQSYADKNAMLWSEVETTYSSTNGGIAAALFRVQNTTGSALTWTPNFYFSSYGGWNESASVAVNGVNVWTNGSGALSSAAVTLTIPANSTSTVIFTSSLGPAFSTVGGLYERAGQLGFTNNCLQLPAGLTFVDDLPASAAYRWATFNTYGNATGWLLGNNPAMFGGVYPSYWTDNNATAGNMSTDVGGLRTLFTNKAAAADNAMIWSDVDTVLSSTNGQVMAALFRVHNSTASPITWTPSFYYSSYGSWNEWASVAVNGSNVWTFRREQYRRTDFDQHLDPRQQHQHGHLHVHLRPAAEPD